MKDCKPRLHLTIKEKWDLFFRTSLTAGESLRICGERCGLREFREECLECPYMKLYQSSKGYRIYGKST